jgi:hypothetical protein
MFWYGGGSVDDDDLWRWFGGSFVVVDQINPEYLDNCDDDVVEI